MLSSLYPRQSLSPYSNTPPAHTHRGNCLNNKTQAGETLEETQAQRVSLEAGFLLHAAAQPRTWTDLGRPGGGCLSHLDLKSEEMPAKVALTHQVPGDSLDDPALSLPSRGSDAHGARQRRVNRWPRSPAGAGRLQGTCPASPLRRSSPASPTFSSRWRQRVREAHLLIALRPRVQLSNSASHQAESSSGAPP